jgi:peptide/nickel transport system permease protein
MRDYVIRRLLLVIPIMLGVSFLTFGVFRVIPGDACVTTLGFGATPETIKDCQAEHGLDKAWYEQYWNWASSVACRRPGYVLTESDLPVNTELGRRLL